MSFLQKIVIVAVGGGGASWNIAGGGSGNVNFTTIDINKSLIAFPFANSRIRISKIS